MKKVVIVIDLPSPALSLSLSLSPPAGHRPRCLLVYINPHGGRHLAKWIYDRKVAPLFCRAGISTDVISEFPSPPRTPVSLYINTGMANDTPWAARNTTPPRRGSPYKMTAIRHNIIVTGALIWFGWSGGESKHYLLFRQRLVQSRPLAILHWDIRSSQSYFTRRAPYVQNAIRRA